jgi:ribosomal protein S18 acetylase RimI-like enzyme
MPTASKVMEIRIGRAEDFVQVAPLVAESIANAFYRPDLTAEQIAENKHIIAIARQSCLSALAGDRRIVFVAKPEPAVLGGFVIVDHTDPAMPEIDWMIVAPDYQGRGLAGRLMQQAFEWIGPNLPIALGVIHFNARAIAFYRKHGFVETDALTTRHRIPRRLMIRPATVST